MRVKGLLELIFVAGVLYGAAGITVEGKGIAPAEIEIKPERDIETIVREIAPQYGFDPVLILAQVEQESGGGLNNFRFEPHLLPKAQKVTKDGEMQIWLASSHGPLHVLGLTAHRMGLKPADFRDKETAIEAGIRWLAKCRENQIARNPKLSGRRLQDAFLTEYNGSPLYPAKVYSHLPKIVARG
jgi:soluble lytic murein transglycosylase-like protein